MISGLNSYSSTMLMTALSRNSQQMEDLTVQLSTGKKAQTYGGLGGQSSKALDLRSEISTYKGYQSSISQAKLQISMMNTALSRIVKIGSEVSGSATSTEYNITDQGQSAGQLTTTAFVKEALGLLDTEVDGDFVFSGTASQTEPTRNYDQIIHGFNGEDGLITVTDERMRADAGADGRGRLTLSSTGGTVSLAEQATDFGYKLDTVTSTLSNATVTGPTGSPPSIDVAFSAAPEPNEVLSFTFTLPDGSSEVIQLKAGDGAADPAEGVFSIGTTPADTAASLESVLAYQIENNVKDEGEAASRIQAAMDFYDTSNGGEPKRVVGTPETATTLDTATNAGKPTLNWYVGDNEPGSARDTAKARVDSHLEVSYGARANEKSIVRQLAYMTAFTLPTYDQDNSVDQDRYTALADAVSAGLSSVNQGDVVKSLQTELGVASKMMTDANARHTTSLSMLETASDGIEGIDDEEVAAKIMVMQTRIEASYSATSMLYNLSLTKFM